MQKSLNKKIVFFGCPLDSDERDESIQEKHAFMGSGQEDNDPYQFIMEFIRKEVDNRLWEEIGSLDVPEWLRPVPPLSEKEHIITDNFVAFIDDNGCRTFSKMIGEHIITEIFPDIPCMLTVDHALTGGVFQKLTELYGRKDISLVVLDSHTDAIPASCLSDAILYDIETNPNSSHNPNDPFLRNRSESYNASSFLYFLLEEGVIEPKNLFIIGISDYPPKRSFRIKDQRIKRYVGIYSGLKNKGVKILTKKDLLTNPSKIRAVLNRIETPYLYISIDMDIGARNALDGVRFRNWQGLNEKQLYIIIEYLQQALSQGLQLAGMDLTEINPRKANSSITSDQDRTYRIASNLIKKMCFRESFHS